MPSSFSALAQVNAVSVGGGPQTPAISSVSLSLQPAALAACPAPMASSAWPPPQDALLNATRMRVGAATQAAWNCSASVEPASATVSALGEIAEVTRSK